MAPLHDATGRLAAEVARVVANPKASAAWHRLRAAVVDVVVVPSPGTRPETVAAFERLGARVVQPADAMPGAYMWELLDVLDTLDAERYVVPDADRLIHWLGSYPDELAALPERWSAHDVLLLARTARAFASHPPCQVLTEGPANRVLAEALGLPGADALSGGYVLSRAAVAAIRRSDAPRDQSFYAEVPLAAARAGLRVGLVTVEGLEWETPDTFRAEIAALGYDAWLATFQTPAQWQWRATMAAGWIDRALAHRRSMPR